MILSPVIANDVNDSFCHWGWTCPHWLEKQIINWIYYTWLHALECWKHINFQKFGPILSGVGSGHLDLSNSCPHIHLKHFQKIRQILSGQSWGISGFSSNSCPHRDQAFDVNFPGPASAFLPISTHWNNKFSRSPADKETRWGDRSARVMPEQHCIYIGGALGLWSYMLPFDFSCLRTLLELRGNDPDFWRFVPPLSAAGMSLERLSVMT